MILKHLVIACVATLSAVEHSKPFILSKAVPLPTLAAAGLAAEPTFADDFAPGWPKQQGLWRVATWKQNGNQMGPERCRVDANGILVQTVLAGKPFQGGSVQGKREFGYGRWIARVKPSAVPGVLNSIFTKDWDDLKTAKPDNDGKMGEVDIEFLSHTFAPGKGQVHLAIHLKDRHNLWVRDVPLDFNPAEAFHDWGFDILPDRVVWHVDGRIIETWTHTPEFRIDPDYEFFFNSWTAEKWIKGPPAQTAEYRIDWVRFHPLGTPPAP